MAASNNLRIHEMEQTQNTVRTVYYMYKKYLVTRDEKGHLRKLDHLGIQYPEGEFGVMWQEVYDSCVHPWISQKKKLTMKLRVDILEGVKLYLMCKHGPLFDNQNKHN